MSTSPRPSSDILPSRSAVERVCEGADPLEIVFQPIVDLRRGIACGYEALSRFPLSPDTPAELWFIAAARYGMAPTLEAHAVRRALAGRNHLPEDCFLAVNVSPEALLSSEVSSELESRALEGIVLEITEQTHAGDMRALKHATVRLGEAGAAVAVDDVGQGYTTLRHLVYIRPDFVKIDRSLITDIDRDEARVAAVRAVGAFADDMDSWVVGEGVERMDELDALERLGVRLGQGYLFGSPSPRMEALDPVLAEHIRSQETFRVRGKGMRGKIVRAPIYFESERKSGLGHLFDLDPMLEWIPLVDERSRPVAIAERPAPGRSMPELKDAMTVGVDEAPALVARRAMTRPRTERFVPIAVCDGRGRYMGLLPVERLVEELAGGSARYAQGSCERRLPGSLLPAGT